MQAKKDSNHEQLTGSVHKLLVRQDRHRSGGRVTAQVGDEVCTVTNFSLFGFAFESPKIMKVGDLIRGARIFASGQDVGSFDVEVKRCQAYESKFDIGVELVSQGLPVETIQHVMEIGVFLGGVADKNQKAVGLPDVFRLNVLELKSRISQIENLVHSFEQRPYQNSFDKEMAFETVLNVLAKTLFEDIRDTNHRLQKTLNGFPEEAYKTSFQYFRDQLGSYIYQSPFTRRSFEKPRGYAGDFEMMNQIYRNDAHGQSLFGRCMEKAVQMHEEPRAVRNRSVYLAENIVSLVKTQKGEINILAVACGPAEELKKAIQHLSQSELSRCTFSLLDQDEEALKYAQKSIKFAAAAESKDVKVNLINKGIKEVLVEGGSEKKYDLIYSAGLFDYFSDPVATRAGLTFSSSLREHGTLIIGNFNISSPNWFGMLTLFDWRLILRGEEDLARLFNYEGFSLTVESEPENVNLFCKISRK